ncbi:MAG: TlpA family protein disulfide reductase [Winogradskyella sp.]|uniref:TlpA family protein disulfide reductase n=1 Tax=Winogradskyella sp. TaxID=1883156 RepID=UPI00179F7425|nr:TlpA disulfide reductase family protein [Winogradskyella sp.]MBT8244640.1 TlpA family protein disulfide reductase [Winogradskyella sp.]NNK23128.1 TlpA family protein disulfide reductase [Winogradskyella sp.]
MKKQLTYIIALLVLGLLGYLGFSVVTKLQEKKEIATRLGTLPEFSFQQLDDTSFSNANLKINTKTIFVYFNSTCDFCQHEAQSISENLDKFTDVQFLFVSVEEKSIIKQFAKKYNLNNKPNITFLHDNTDTFSNSFGANSIPYLLIYDANGNLLKKHKGQLNANGILKILNP